MSWNQGNRQRSIAKLITFSPQEWERADGLHQLADGVPKYRRYGDFARAMLTLGEVNVTEVKPLTDPRPIAREIAKLGVNVNQIAHWANLNKTIGDEDVQTVVRLLEQIRTELDELIENARTARADALKDG